MEGKAKIGVVKSRGFKVSKASCASVVQARVQDVSLALWRGHAISA